MDQKQKTKPQMKCMSPGCSNLSNMQCPVCIKMGLQSSFFCSQQCFKGFWPLHKLTHISKQDQVKKSIEKYKFSGPLRPGIVSCKLLIPEHIHKPDYFYTGQPEKQKKSVYQKNIPIIDNQHIKNIRQISNLARQTLDVGHKAVKQGATTDQIDRIVHQFIIQNQAYPSPYNYYRFPKSLCTSVNQVICHGIPDSRPIQAGDIINLDVTIYKNGFNIDLNQTYLVGEVSESSKFLVQKAYDSLRHAIQICKPGTLYRQVGNVISKYIQDNGLAVNKTYCGHGVGQLFHCAPMVPHYSKNKAVGTMKVGHMFTIEPMINQGTHKDITWPDGWTAVTADGQRSAQFEHTLLINEGGCEILTKRIQSSPSLNIHEW